jgi:hypothetical protein
MLVSNSAQTSLELGEIPRERRSEDDLTERNAVEGVVSDDKYLLGPGAPD